MDDASAREAAGDDATPSRMVGVALVVDGFVQPAWVVEAVEEALASGRVRVGAVLVAAGTNASNRGEATAGRNVARRARGLLRRLYDAFDRERFRPELSPFEPRNIRSLVGAVPEWTLASPGDEAGQKMLRRRIEAAGVDLLLNLAHHVQAAALAGLAPLGAAAFRFGSSTPWEHDSAGFDEVVCDANVIAVRLELWGGCNAEVTRTVQSVTNVHPFSAGRTRALAARHAVLMLGRLAGELLLDAVPPPAEPAEEERGRLAPPLPDARRHSTMSLVIGLLRLGARYVRYLAAERGWRDQWILAYYRGDADARAGASAGASACASAGAPELRLSRYRQIVPPIDRFWADPFPLVVDGRDYILLEELLFGEELGYISVVELGDDGILGQPVTVLKRPFHLSYPFTFSHEGQLYLLPEMAEEGRLELYRAIRPPYEWVLDRVLVDGPMLVDATLEEIDGRWWMFACEYRPGLPPWTDLLLFHAESPLGPWTAHPRNPVISDVRFARPAGRLFRSNGAWMRPAQDCSRSYGDAISLRRIVRITPSDYHEVEERSLAAAADSGMRGPHTINAAGGLSTMDFKRRVRR